MTVSIKENCNDRKLFVPPDSSKEKYCTKTIFARQTEWASSRENLSSGFATRSDSTRPLQHLYYNKHEKFERTLYSASLKGNKYIKTYEKRLKLFAIINTAKGLFAIIIIIWKLQNHFGSLDKLSLALISNRDYEDRWSIVPKLSFHKNPNQRTIGPVSLTWVLRIC